MDFDILALAEGATNDVRGALALVGVNQRVIAPGTLPFNIKQRLVMTLSDEMPDSSGREFGHISGGIVSLRVLDPAGSATFVTSEDIKVPKEKRWLDLPLVINIIMDVDIKGDSYGIYIVEVTYKPSDSEELTRRFPLYIVPAQAALSSGEGPIRAFAAQ